MFLARKSYIMLVNFVYRLLRLIVPASKIEYQVGTSS